MLNILVTKTRPFCSTCVTRSVLLVLCLHNIFSILRNAPVKRFKKINRFLIYLWFSKRFVDFSLFCGFEKDLWIFIFLKIWKRLTDLNFFGGFEKDLTISNYFVVLKKIWFFFIFLSVWKRFLDLKIFLWIDLETINLFKNSCGYKRYLLIWKKVVDLKNIYWFGKYILWMTLLGHCIQP